MTKTFIKIISFSAISLVILWLLGVVPLELVKVKIQEIPAMQEEETAGDMSKAFKTYNLLGTPTVPNNTAATAATTSAIYKIDESVNQVNFNLRAVTASSSGRFLYFIEQSNDASCNSTATATAATINWFDANPQTSTSGNAITINAATTTYYWTPGGNGRGTAVSLTNLNAECLKFTLGTASTTYYVEAKAKANN